MMPILQIGPLALQLPGLVILVGLWLGLSLSERYASVYDIDSNNLYNLVLVTLISGVIGARVTYILRYPTAFSHSPLSIISINPGLLDLSGGIAFAFIATIIYLQRAKMPFWSTLDSLVPMLALINISLAGANLASGDGFGAPADLPWSIYLFGELRHPTQVYEMLLAGFVLILMLPGSGHIAKGIERINASGLQFIVFLILSSLIRIFTEAFHADSKIIVLGLRRAQIGAWLILAMSLIIFTHKAFRFSNDLNSL
jgi:prolipoprotein diacylglyceryl transferase